MNDLAEAIRTYESDTFNARASRVTKQEAWMIAQALFARLLLMVREGGQMHCDGTVLADMLEAVREPS
jgi:hypothetical protein